MGLLGFFIKLSFLFLVLLGLTHVLYHRFLHRIQPNILSGSFILGVGAYLWLCLPEFGLPHFVMQIAVLELAIIWVYMALALAQLAIEGRLLLDKNADRLGLGLWVVATAIVGLLVDKVEPLLHGSILFLALVVLLLGVVYFVIIGQWMLTHLSNRARGYVNSLVLCSTITIQLCVWFEVELFLHPLPLFIYQTVILMGLLFYAVGFFGLLKYFLYARTKYRYLCFTARSTMLYSAMAVSGLAMIMSRSFPSWAISLTWYWTVFMFVAVEAAEINRLCLSLKKRGLTASVFRYKNIQWIRIFSLASFYAFALTRYHASTDGWFVTLLMYSGLYVVTILFLLQCIVAGFVLFKQNLRAA